MPDSENKKGLFSHEVFRGYAASGKEVRFTVYPGKLRARSLAGGINFGNLPCDVLEIYKQEIISRMSPAIDESCERENLDLEVFRAVLKNNISKVIENTWFRNYRSPNYWNIKRVDCSGKREVLEREERDTNASIFWMKMKHSIDDLASDDYIKAVCGDYGFVRGVVKNPDMFPELEQLCAPQLGKFMHSRIGGLDKESQRQEGLLALWTAARDYRAENFARFSKLAAVVLRNKFNNLLRYGLATKRRANMHLIPMGNSSNGWDSEVAHDLDRLVCDHWVQQQAVYDAIDEQLDRSQLVLLDADDIAYDTLRDINRHGHTRQISHAELNIEQLNLSRAAKKMHYEEKVGVESFEDRAVMPLNGEYDTNRLEVDENNFPHLNEREVFIRYAIEELNPHRFPQELNGDHCGKDWASEHADELDKKF